MLWGFLDLIQCIPDRLGCATVFAHTTSANFSRPGKNAPFPEKLKYVAFAPGTRQYDLGSDYASKG